jgi:hypothetical protein
MMHLMNVKKLFFISLICAICSATVVGQGRVISQAYEVLLNNFQAPISTSSTIVFKECDDCEAMHIRVTEATRYSVNGRPVRLEDFRIAILQAGDRDNMAVTVLHHLESNVVESIDASI